MGFVWVCFWVSNERVVQDFSESFFWSVSWDPGMGMVFFLSDREPGSSSFFFFFFVRLLDDE